MKKWKKEEIYSVGGWPLQGPFITERIQQLLKNQNEIIEELERIHKLLYHSELLPK